MITTLTPLLVDNVATGATYQLPSSLGGIPTGGFALGGTVIGGVFHYLTSRRVVRAVVFGLATTALTMCVLAISGHSVSPPMLPPTYGGFHHHFTEGN